MNALLDILPGIKLPIPEVARTLSNIWDGADGPDQPSPSEFRASQMNLLIHFGPETTPNEAESCFQTALRFAERYPCRIIMLCPGGTTVEDFEGKLFSQCFTGESGTEKVCSEALILGYPLDQTLHVANQASVWLETDLPVYHWLHRMPDAWIGDYFRGLLMEGRRVVVDGAVDYDLAGRIRETITRPMRDLAFCRLLPVRQVVGNYLSGVDPAVLVDGLETVRVFCRAGREGEGREFLGWLEDRLRDCAVAAGVEDLKVGFEVAPCGEGEFELQTEWTYTNSHRFAWRGDITQRRAQLDARFGRCHDSFPLIYKTMQSHEALAEALFF